MPGVIALQAKPFETYEMAAKEMEILNDQLKSKTNELQIVAHVRYL